jgi:hypothetical protein
VPIAFLILGSGNECAQSEKENEVQSGKKDLPKERCILIRIGTNYKGYNIGFALLYGHTHGSGIGWR